MVQTCPSVLTVVNCQCIAITLPTSSNTLALQELVFMRVVSPLATLLVRIWSRVPSILSSGTILATIVHLQSLKSRKEGSDEAYDKQLDLPEEARDAPRWRRWALLSTHGVTSCCPWVGGALVHHASSRTCAAGTSQQGEG